VLREPLVYRDFMLQVPTGPGLGVDIDTDKLRSLRRRKPIRRPPCCSTYE
jgi:muconate cycloisomerase